jgi:hypothetical protein
MLLVVRHADAGDKRTEHRQVRGRLLAPLALSGVRTT